MLKMLPAADTVCTHICFSFSVYSFHITVSETKCLILVNPALTHTLQIPLLRYAEYSQEVAEVDCPTGNIQSFDTCTLPECSISTVPLIPYYPFGSNLRLSVFWDCCVSVTFSHAFKIYTGTSFKMCHFSLFYVI